MREPVFNHTLQLEVGVRDLEATMRRYVDDYGTNDHSERRLADVEIDRGVLASEADAAVVRGAFDGGGGSANPARFIAHATCLQT
jgi:hypothetical protein